MDPTSHRVLREKEAWNAPDVVTGMLAMQQRFWHVFDCPNTRNFHHQFSECVRHAATDRDVLGLGCWKGEDLAFYHAHGPKSLTGIDISDVAIQEASARYGHLARFHTMDAHALTFPDASFDLVMGRAILHHLDWTRAIGELNRVLRPGGYAMFQEPLGDNPAAKIFRALTPNARTVDERPLDAKQIQWADKTFGKSSHIYANLTSIPVGMLTSQFKALSPDNLALRLCDRADTMLARTPIRSWMRYVGLIWQKTRSDERRFNPPAVPGSRSPVGLPSSRRE